jgi:hypothetical protein
VAGSGRRVLVRCLDRGCGQSLGVGDEKRLSELFEN